MYECSSYIVMKKIMDSMHDMQNAIVVFVESSTWMPNKPHFIGLPHLLFVFTSPSSIILLLVRNYVTLVIIAYYTNFLGDC